MRNLSYVVCFGLLLAILGSVVMAAPAPPHLEELTPFRVGTDDIRFVHDEIRKRNIAPNAQVQDPPFNARALALLRGELSRIRDLSFSPDGKTLYTTCQNRGVWIWDVSRRKLAEDFKLKQLVDHIRDTRSVLSPDGKMAATWNNRKIVLWDTTTPKIVDIFNEDDWIKWVVFSPDGKTLSAHSHSEQTNTLMIWNIANKNRVAMHKIRGRSYRPMTADSGIKTPLFVDVHQSNDADKTAGFTLVNAFTGHADLTCEGMKVDSPSIFCFALNRVESIVASVGTNSPVQLWNRRSGRRIALFKPLPNNFRGLGFSPDGKILIAIYEGRDWQPHDCGFVLYSVPSGEILADVKQPDRLPPWAFSPDGRLLAVKYKEEIKVWRIPDAWRRDK